MAVPARRFARVTPWLTAAFAAVMLLALACKDDGTAPPQVVGALRFEHAPESTPTAFSPIRRGFVDEPVTVEIVDDAGNRIETATDTVTLALEANPGALLLHASGIQNPNTTDTTGRMLELIDVLAPGGPVERYMLAENWRLDAPTSMTWDAANDRYLLVNRAIDNLYRGDPRSGEATLVGDGTAPKVAGMAFEVGGSGRLFGVVNKFFPGSNTDSLFEIDPNTGELTDIGTLTPTDLDEPRDILYFSSMAMRIDPSDPDVGTLYATAVMNGATPIGHALVEIDPEALTARFIGDTTTRMPAMAAHPDTGVLYGVEGDNTSNPRRLVTIDLDDGSITDGGIDLVNGADGQGLAFVEARLYGTLTASAVDGVATFDDLRIDGLGNGYTISATASERAPVTSGAIDMIAPAPGGVVDFTESAITVPENAGPVTVTMQIDAAQTHDVFVTAAVGGTAGDVNAETPDSDLDYLDYVVFVLSAGETEATFTFELVDDGEQEDDDETIVFNIKTAPLAGALGVNQTLTITVTDP